MTEVLLGTTNSAHVPPTIPVNGGPSRDICGDRAPVARILIVIASLSHLYDAGVATIW